LRGPRLAAVAILVLSLKVMPVVPLTANDIIAPPQVVVL